MKEKYVWVFELDQKKCESAGFWLFTSRKKAEDRAKAYFCLNKGKVTFDYMDNTAQVLVDGTCRAWVMKTEVK